MFVFCAFFFALKIQEGIFIELVGAASVAFRSNLMIDRVYIDLAILELNDTNSFVL